ncbi:CBS domain-containing protein [Terripilifer ovatus]|uniref:CBS domain-containing protein n=1 Tax=Terripilifer ovatus TaxID=3032367 RepID=UPI003AB9B4EA
MAWKASDVMVTNVITVGPQAGVQDAGRFLLASRISAAIVVGGHGELLGVVSEGDLMRRSETDTEGGDSDGSPHSHRKRLWWVNS